MPKATKNLVEFKKVTKKFGSIVALQEISFEIEKGDFVFITGPSGAGKSTILKLILAELTPTSGEILIDGINVGRLEASHMPKYRQKIGVVFQDFRVLTERTVKENVEIALAVIGINQGEWDARVKQVLKLAGLDKRANHFPSQLSGGELQRVSLARALVVNPVLILADEPTGNLDWETADAIMDLFEKINKEGKTIIMATHNKEIVGKLKKREIKLKEGKVVK
ncbi:cell division ATP-binding protein FtsE [Candidatus Woesebacteria bacterium]|nr:cell division ATP-binding protein FtsE [Candidatus Woesebacteria bacterium]